MGIVQSCTGKRKHPRYGYTSGKPPKRKPKKKKISQKLESSGNKLKQIKSKQESITKTLSSHDVQLVDDKVRCAEKKCDELVTRANKQLFASSNNDQSIQEFKNQVDGILAWLKEMSNHISSQDNNISYLVGDASKRVDDIKNLEIEMKKEEAPITQLCQNGKVFLKNISAKSQVHKQLKKWLAEIKTTYPNMLDRLVQMLERWQKYHSERISLSKDMEDTTRWLQNTELDIQRFQTFSLNHLSIEGQQESIKKLKVEIEKYEVPLASVLKMGNTISNQCCLESQAELQHKLSGLEARYNSLKQQITTYLGDVELFLNHLGKYESNCEQLKKWYKATKMKSSNPIHTDCATSVLRKQVEEYQALNQSCEEKIILLPDIETTYTVMQPHLSETDNQTMQEQIKDLNSKTNSVSQEVSKSLKLLQESLRQHDEIDSDVHSLSICLESIEKQTSLVTPIGSSVDEAEKLLLHYKELSLEMESYNHIVERLTEYLKRFSTTGQSTSATNIQQILTKYTLLNEHITQLLNCIKAAVALRKQYHAEFAGLETAFKDSCQKIDEISVLNIPTTKKVNKYKVVYNELQTCEKGLGAMAEKANQIDLDLPSNNDNSLTSQLRIVQSDINTSKRNIDQKIQECQMKEMNEKELSNSLKETIVWLEQKYIFLSSSEPLHLTESKIDSISQKYQQASQESLDRIAMIKKKVLSKETDTSSVDSNLKHQLALIEELEVKILDAAKEKEKFLAEAKANRDQFEQSLKQVTDWVTGAEKLLDSGFIEDLDPDLLYQQLEEHKEYLSEASLCQDEMDILTDTSLHLVDSLDCNDKETLQQSLKSLNGRFNNAVSSLQKRQVTIEEKIDQWKDFQGYLQDFETILQDIHAQWSELENNQSFDDQNKIIQSISQTDNFLKSLSENNELINKINESAKALDSSKSPSCQSAIKEATNSVNQRWDSIKNQAEEKYKILMNISNLWQNVDDNMKNLESDLHRAEERLSPQHLKVDIAASDAGLQEQQNTLKKIVQNLNATEPTLKKLKDSLLSLQQCLPTAEAKLHSQNQMLLFTERYERISYQCQEYSTQICDEINERKNLNKELDKTLEWLQDCHITVQRLGNVTDVSTSPGEKTKKLTQEIDCHMKELMPLVKDQESKYQRCSAEMPTVMKLKVSQVVTAQRELLESLKGKEERLKLLQSQRKNYRNLMDDICQWFTSAELKLKEKISNVEEDNAKHKELMKEFGAQQKKLSNLRGIGGQIAKHSTDSVEKNKVQSTLASLNKRHSALQASISCRTQQLTEVEGLLRQFHETSSVVTCWLDTSEASIAEPLIWADLDKVKQQHKIYERLSTELLENQSKVDYLNSTVKHLARISDASEPAHQVSLISQRLFNMRGKVNNNFTSLDDAMSQMVEFENQLKSVNEWLVFTRQQLHVSDTTLTIQDQLSLNEKILEDIENQKKKLEELLQLLPSQMQNSNYKSSHHSSLMSEIEELHKSAKEHHDWLLKAVKQKEENDQEIRHVKAALSSVHTKLSHTYNTSADIEILRREKQEHEALAAQIRSNQARLNEIKRRNKELSKEANFQKRSTVWNMSPAVLSFSTSEPQMSTLNNSEDSKLYDSGVFLSTSDIMSPNFHSFNVSTPLNFSSSGASTPETPLSLGSIISKGPDYSKTLNLPVRKIFPDKLDSQNREYFAFNFDERTPERFSAPTKILASSTENSKPQNLIKNDMKGFGSAPKLMTFGSNVCNIPLNNYSLICESNSAPILRTHESNSNKFQWPSKQQLPGTIIRFSPRPLSVQYQLETKYMGNRSSPTAIHDTPDGENSKEDAVKVVGKDDNLFTKRDIQLSLSEEQEEYQKLIQDISSKLQLLNTKFWSQPSVSHLNIETHIIEHNAIVQDFNNLKNKIDQINNLSENVSRSIDPQGLQAINTTLSAFNDRVRTLEVGIKDREHHLQEISASKKIHIQELEAYLKRFRDMEHWLSETKNNFGNSISQNEQDPSVESLTAKLEENKKLQSKIQQKLQELSDMALQCDRACEFENHKSAEEMRSDLVKLQNMLAILKLNVLEQQNHLKQALKEAERKQNIPSDLESEEFILENWFVPSGNIVLESEDKVMVLEQQHQQEKLRHDFSEHRKLVQYISSQTIHHPTVIVSAKLEGRSPDDSATNESDWRRLHACTFVAKQQLMDRVQVKPLGLYFSSAQYMYNVGNAVDKKPNFQSHHIKQCLSDLNGCWKKTKQLPVEDQMSVTTNQQLQKKEQQAMWTISHWLDTMEQYLFTVPPKNGIPQKLKENETMQKSINSLKDKLNTSVMPVSRHLTKTLPASEQMLPDETLMFITDRMLLLTSQIQIHADHMKTWKKYEEIMSKLRTELVSIQSTDNVPASDKESSYDMMIEQMKKAEIQLKELESSLNEFKNKEDESSAIPNWIFSEFTDLQLAYMEAKRKVMDRKATLLQSSSIQTQYEKLLEDFADFLVTAKNKLKKSTTTTARDLTHLQQQLKAHKDFFSDMEGHRALLDSLAEQCDQSMREQHRSEHQRLSALTDEVKDQANLYGQHLNRLVKQWVLFNVRLGQLKEEITTIENSCAPLISETSPNVSLQAIRDRKEKYKEIQTEMSRVKPLVFQVLDEGKMLLLQIDSSSLESNVTSIASTWAHLHSQITDSNSSLEDLYSQVEQYNASASLICTWLDTAKIKLATLGQLSEEDSQNISVIRNKMEKLLEFRKDVDSELATKNKLLSIVFQLQEHHPDILSTLNIKIDTIKEQWDKLQQDISCTEQILHSAQMALMPSRQALQELALFLKKVSKAISNDAKKQISLPSKIGETLKKYQGFKIEIENKQLTLDFVNQCVLKPSNEDSPSAHAEKAEFAEKLSDLNEQWTTVNEELMANLSLLTTLVDKWEEFESLHRDLSNWFVELNDRIKKHELIGMEVNVKHSIKECQALHKKLLSKEADVEKLKLLGNELMQLKRAPSGSKKMVKEKIDGTVKEWQQTNNRLTQQEIYLNDVKVKWNEYSTEKTLVLNLLTELEYYLGSNSSLTIGDYHTLKIQISKLKSLSGEIQQKAPKQENLIAVATELLQICESPVKQDIQNTTSNIQNRWKTLTAELQDRAKFLEQCLDMWRAYDDKYLCFSQEMAQNEKCWDELAQSCADDSQLKTNLNRVEELQAALDAFQSKLPELYQLSDEMGPKLDAVSIVNITSRQTALEQRLLLLRHSADKLSRQISDNLFQYKRFEQLMETINHFLQKASDTLSNQPSQSASEDIITKESFIQFKELLIEFNINAPLLDNLNELGYRMVLSDNSIQELQELNHKWYQLKSETVELCHSLQDNVLLQQDFTEKCSLWMAYLAQIENELAVEIRGNLKQLIDQQKKYQTLKSELVNKQQILHAIIADGQKMQKLGDSGNADFDQNLSLLSEQWHNVVKRINQKVNTVDSLISLWKNFNEQSNKFHNWLSDQETSMDVLGSDVTSMRRIRNDIQKLKNIQNEFKLQADRYELLHKDGQKLLQYMDGSSAEELKENLRQLEQQRQNILKILSEQMAKSQEATRQHDFCEKELEELFAWLKDIRKITAKPLPTSYVDLEADLHQCKDVQSSAVSYDEKYQVLSINVNRLNHILQPEDVNLLQQRMKLLDKQWMDICMEIELRKLQIKNSLDRWPQHYVDINNFCSWCELMETKIVSMNTDTIETMLEKLEKVYDSELSAKQADKEALVLQSQVLKEGSGELRSTDIDCRIQQADQKWKHLQAVINNRKHKLQETMLAVQQLDVNMKELQKWLKHMEDELFPPLTFTECDHQEIETKLEHHQGLQREIERYSAGITSVHNLCEVLLHDTDACRTEVEYNALNEAKNTLDKRWQNICQLSPERYARIEETWRLWKIFLRDYNSFSNWLGSIENVLAEYSDSQISEKESVYEEIENIQQEINENHDNLESINKQYKFLVKEGCVDNNNEIKDKTWECNERWDNLSNRVLCIMGSMRKSAGTWDEYHLLYDELMKWLKDVDVKLTQVEKSEDVVNNIKCLSDIKHEENLKNNKFQRFGDLTDQLLEMVEEVGEKARLQKEVDEFENYHAFIMERLHQLHEKTNAGEDTVDDPDITPYDQDYRDVMLRGPASELKVIKKYSSDYQDFQTLTPDSPVLKCKSIPIPPDQFSSDFSKDDRLNKIRNELPEGNQNAEIEACLEEMLSALENCAHKMVIGEEQLRCQTPVGPELDQGNSDYIKIMSDCQDSVDNVSKVYSQIKVKLGLTSISTVEQEVSNVSDRWNRLKSHIIEKDSKLQNNRRDWSQFKTDLKNLLVWLENSEIWLDSINNKHVCISEHGQICKKLKTLQTELTSKGTIIDSLNLTGSIYSKGALEGNRTVKNNIDIMNKRWANVNSKCKNLQLHLNGVDSDRFIEEVKSLSIWIRYIEDQLKLCRTHTIDIDNADIQEKYSKLKDLKSEIEQKQPHISSLKETSMHISFDNKDPAKSKAKDDIHITSALAYALSNQISTSIAILESRADFNKKILRHQSNESQERTTLSPFRRIRNFFFGAVPGSSSASPSPERKEQLSDTNTGDTYNESQTEEIKKEVEATENQPTSSSSSSLVAESNDTLMRSSVLPPITPVTLSRSSKKSSPAIEPVPSPIKVASVPAGPKIMQTPPVVSRKKNSSGAKQSSGKAQRAAKSKVVKASLPDVVDGPIKPVPYVPHARVIDADEESVESPGTCCSSFCRRAVRAALPLQILLLLLLGLASLLPMTQEDYSCALSNNMRRSLTSMLHYTDGPPPT